MSEKIVEKKVIFKGATNNEAQAIQIVLSQIKEHVLSRNEAHFESVKNAYEKNVDEYESLSKTIEIFNQHIETSSLSDEQFEHLSNIKDKLMHCKDSYERMEPVVVKMQEGLNEINNYIKFVEKEKIKETENETEVIYEYDTEFFKVWLGLARLFFTLEIE